jgi:hypothetical protein
MSDPDLIERIARAHYEAPLPDGEPWAGKWVDAHPEDRAHWRGTVASIVGLYEAEQARPWPRVDHPTQRDLDRMTGQPR